MLLHVDVTCIALVRAYALWLACIRKLLRAYAMLMPFLWNYEEGLCPIGTTCIESVSVPLHCIIINSMLCDVDDVWIIL